MALTPAERAKRYREKLKQNAEKYEEQRKKQIERVKKAQKKIKELRDSEKDKRRKIWREQKKKQREAQSQEHTKTAVAPSTSQNTKSVDYKRKYKNLYKQYHAVLKQLNKVRNKNQRIRKIKMTSLFNPGACVTEDMAVAVDLKPVVKYIVDGTLAENLCRVCLVPLGNVFENISTKFCTADVEFSVADVLEEICNIKIDPFEQCSVCSNCFVAASSAYRFYLLSQQSNNIINFYVEELEKHMDQLEMVEENKNISFCITLPSIELDPMLNFKVEDCLANYRIGLEASVNASRENMNTKMKNIGDEKLILVVKEEPNTPSYYRIKPDGTLKEIPKKLPLAILQKEKRNKKISRNRDPMVSLQCSKCPVNYRFISKLKEHMKLEHNIDLYICKICKAQFEDELEYTNHQTTHTNMHYCAYCNAVFKKSETIIAHLKAHENIKNYTKMEGAHVCEVCGVILPNKEALEMHHDKKHIKKFTCYYCGRMYRGEYSFEMHVKKHEKVMKLKDRPQTEKVEAKKGSAPSKSDKKRLICSTCGKDFGDKRSLKWHSMLHTNERPYTCDVCGRGFISVNRRNQHAVCAHTAPTRRCPLCPALFHLRSMVNTHIKKVHLRAHKRRSRASKHKGAAWRAETVPIQELSVSIQSAILDLKSKQEDKTRLATKKTKR